ncbi:Protein FAM32A [Euphorbia peplus]|nr:Protein FAM32A [Euphorbia peplus]
MSGYENVVAGKLRLKGKALDVKTCGISQKIMKNKKKKKHQSIAGGKNGSLMDESDSQAGKVEGADNLTDAQRRYLEQWEKIDVQRLSKMATKSHRDRVHEFNQYLANLTDHYDIPKVGPG